MARPSFLRRTVRKVLRGATWFKSVGRYNERFPRIFRAGKWHPAASEGSLWMTLFGMRTSPLSLVGKRHRPRNNMRRLLRVEGLEQKQLLAVDVSVEATDADAGEPANDGAFTVMLSAPSPSDTTVSYSLTGAATNGGDYEFLPGIVTIPAGSTSAVLPIDIINDTDVEGPETVLIALSVITAGEPGDSIDPANADAELTIADDDPALPAGPFATTYVDDDFSGSSPGDPIADADPQTPGNQPATFGADAFATIQEGVDAVAVGGTVIVNEGVYTENVTIGSSKTDIHLSGADQATVTVHPAVSAPNPGGAGSMPGGESNMLLVEANNVEISGINFDGDNPSIGGDIDARNGIIVNHNLGTITGLNVHDVTVQNVFLRGIQAGSTGGTFTISNNTVTNVQEVGESYGIANFGGSGTISGNAVSNASQGIVTDQSMGTTITGNTVSAPLVAGIASYANGSLGGAGDTISGGNLVLGVAPASDFASGIVVYLPSFSVTVSDNTVSDVFTGLHVGGSAGGTADFTNNLVSRSSPLASSVGVLVTNDDAVTGGSDTSAALNANTVTGYETGVYAQELIGPFADTEVILSFTSGAISGGLNNILLEGDLKLSGDSLGTLALDSPADFYIGLLDGAYGNGIPGDQQFQIDALNVTFDGKTGAAMTPGEQATLESKLFHEPDDGSLGFILAAPAVVPTSATVSIAVSDADAAEPNNDGEFTVTLSQPVGTDTTITYNVMGSADNGVDYQMLSGFLVIPAGDTSAPLPVDIIDDSDVEGAETVFVALSTASGGVSIDTANDEAQLTIADNDPTFAPPVITTNTGSTAAQGGTDVITQGELETTDPDTPATGLTYTVTTPPANGTLSSLTFTQADINAGTVTYTHNGSSTTSDSFAFNVSDGTSTVSGTFSITVQPGGLVSIAVSDGSAGEPANDGAFTVTLSQPSATDTTITYNVMGTADNGTDYQMLSGFLVIPAGSTSAPLPVDVIDDSLAEGPETVFVALSTVSGSPGFGIDAANDDAELTIADDDPSTLPPVITTNAGSTVAEGGTDVITQGELETTDLDTPASGLTYTVTVLPTNGTLSATTFTQADINAGTVTYTHNGGETTSDSFSFTVTDGSTTAGPQTFNITVTPVADGPTITTNTGSTVAQGGNDTITQAELETTDPDTAPAGLTYTVTTPPANGTLSALTFTQADINAGLVTYQHNGSATSGDSFAFDVSDGTSTVSGTFAITVTPVTPGPTVSIAVSDPNAAEPANDGAFTVTLSQPSAQDTTITYNVMGTATNDVDYEMLSGFLVIPAGSTSAPLPVDVIDDLLVEGDETVFVALSTATGQPGVSIDPANDEAQLVIADNDPTFLPAPVVTTNTGSTVAEGGTDVITQGELQTTDADTAAAGLTYTVTTAPANGTLRLSGAPTSTFTQADINAGNVTYVHNGSETTSDSFAFTVTDGSTTVGPQTFNITVTPVNDAPIAQDDSFTTAEETPVSGNVLTNDVDPETGTNAGLTVTEVNGSAANVGATITLPSGAMLTMASNGGFTYVPANDFSGADTFTYTVEDPQGAEDTATVTIIVEGLNDPPDANNDLFTTNENTPVSGNVLANDTDPDGDTLTAVVLIGPTNGTLAFNSDGSFTYTPNAGFSGTDSFTYQARDGRGGRDNATVTINVTNLNTAPDAKNESFTTSDEEPVSGNVLANDTDPDGDVLTATLIDAPNNGTVVLNSNGTFTYTPNQGFVGKDTFDYRATDPEGASDDATVTIEVVVGPDAPVAVDDNFVRPEDTVVTGNFLANDFDPDNSQKSPPAAPGAGITLVSVNPPNQGSLVFQSNGDFTYTPPQNFVGTITFTYVIRDPEGNTDEGKVTMTFTAVNEVDARNDVFSSKQGESVSGNVLANNGNGPDTDPEGNAFSVTSNTAPANGTLTVGVEPDGDFTYVPNAGFSGTDTFTYTITDALGATDTATVTINVRDINDPPIAGDDTATVQEDTANNFIPVLANDTDPDDDDKLLFVSAVSPPMNGTVTIVSGTRESGGGIRYTPNTNFFGTDTFTYTVSDPRGGTDTGTVTVTVANIADVPAAVDDSFKFTEDTTVTFSATDLTKNDFNPDQQTLAITNVNDPVGGTVTLNPNGTVTFDPDPNFVGTASFDYKISGADAKDEATVTITYTALEDAPVVTDDFFETNINTPIKLTTAKLLENDTDPDAGNVLRVTGVSNATGGTVVFDQTAGTITFTPANNFTGAGGFNYTVTDDQGGFSTGRVTINVIQQNRAPDAKEDTFTTVEDNKIELTPSQLLGNDVDVDGDQIKIISVQSAANGTVAVTRDSKTNDITKITFIPAANFENQTGTNEFKNTPASFTYTITDDDAVTPLTDTAKVNINVTAVNDRPDAVDDKADTDEEQPVAIDVLANDTDVDNVFNGKAANFGLTITSVSTPANGNVSINANNQIVYNPNNNFVGTDTFTYTISDGALTDTATVTVTVGNVDEVNAVNDDAKVNEDSINNPINVLANDFDPDPEPDTFKVTKVTQGMNGIVVIGPNGSNVLYTPDPNFNGTDTFTYTITDDEGAMDTATVTVTVEPQVEGPDANNDSAVVNEDSGPNVIDVRANDEHRGGLAFTIVAVTQPANGTVEIRPGGLTLVYIPDPDFASPPTDTFTYTIRDANNRTDTATVTVTVLNLQDPPNAVNDTGPDGTGVLVSENSTNNPINVLANDSDPDGDPLTVISVTQPANGTVTVGPGGANVLYTPDPRFDGGDVFTYTISDGKGGRDSASVLVNVRGVDNNFRGTEGDDVFLVRLASDGDTIQVFNNATGSGTPLFTESRATLQGLSFDLLGGNDRLILEFANGDPVPTGGIDFNGGSGNDQLTLRNGGTATGAYMPSSTTQGQGVVTVGGGSISLTGVEPIDVSGFATFTVVTPNANDTLLLSSPGVNTAQLTGTSGGVTLSPVTFRDVGTFTVNAAANDGGAGNDSLTMTPGVGRTIPNNVGFLEFNSGTGTNTVTLTNGSARLDATVATGGTLETTLGDGAELVTHRFRQNTLSLGDGSRATVLSAGTLDAVSRLNLVVFDDGSTLDLNDNSLVIDFAPQDPATVQAVLIALRDLIREGRGGAGVGNGTWTGTGITSSAAAAANALNPESRSIGFAHNGTLPLGPYTTWRGQPVDNSTFLVGFTRTGDADLDSIVGDNDATILGAFYPSANATWQMGDFDFSGTVDDNDATLLGAFYNPNATPFPAPAPAAAPLAAAGEAIFAEIGSGSGSSSTSSGVKISAADLAALADEIFATEDGSAGRKTKFGV